MVEGTEVASRDVGDDVVASRDVGDDVAGP